MEEEDEDLLLLEEDEESLAKKESAAIKMESWTRGVLARIHLIKKAQELYEKVFDEKERKYYYINTMTFQTTWVKPKLLRSGDAMDDLDREAGKIAMLGQKERLQVNYRCPKLWDGC